MIEASKYWDTHKDSIEYSYFEMGFEKALLVIEDKVEKEIIATSKTNNANLVRTSLIKLLKRVKLKILGMLAVLLRPTMDISNLARYKSITHNSNWYFIDTINIQRTFDSGSINYKPIDLIEKMFYKYDTYLLRLRYKKETK